MKLFFVFCFILFLVDCHQIQTMNNSPETFPETTSVPGNEMTTSFDQEVPSALVYRSDKTGQYLFHRQYTRVASGHAHQEVGGWRYTTEPHESLATNVTSQSPAQATNSLSLYAEKPDIAIGVLVPFTLDLDHIVTKVAPALEMAVDKVTLLMGPWAFNSLSLMYADSKCNTAESMNKAIHFAERTKTVAFFGPVCDYAIAPIARQAKYWNTPLITVGGAALDFMANKQKLYPTLTRVGIASIKGTLELIVTVCEKSNWQKVKILYNSTGQDYKSHGFCHFMAEYFMYMFSTTTIDTGMYKIDVSEDRPIEEMLSSEISTKFSDMDSVPIPPFLDFPQCSYGDQL